MDTPDHDILLRLVENVKNLKEGQDAFHKDMKEAISDLRNNYQGLLNDHETRLVALEATKADFRQKLDDNEKYTKFLIWLSCGIGVIVIGILIYHLTGYKI